MIGCPSWIESCSNTMRGTMSVVVPAPNGTITCRGLVGQFSALAAEAIRATANVADTSSRCGFMASPGGFRSRGRTMNSLRETILDVQYTIDLESYAVVA